MPAEAVVWVKCKFSRGGFPSEMVFRIDAPPGGEYTGLAPVEYCNTEMKQPFSMELKRGETKSGFLIGLEFGNGSNGGATQVSLPNGEIYEISKKLLTTKETPGRVPLES